MCDLITCHMFSHHGLFICKACVFIFRHDFFIYLFFCKWFLYFHIFKKKYISFLHESFYMFHLCSRCMICSWSLSSLFTSLLHNSFFRFNCFTHELFIFRCDIFTRFIYIHIYLFYTWFFHTWFISFPIHWDKSSLHVIVFHSSVIFTSFFSTRDLFISMCTWFIFTCDSFTAESCNSLLFLFYVCL